jgi:hypothetical protein
VLLLVNLGATVTIFHRHSLYTSIGLSPRTHARTGGNGKTRGFDFFNGGKNLSKLARVLLFSDKSSVTPVMKQLASKMNRRLIVGQAYTKKAKKVMEKFGVTKQPTLIVIPYADGDDANIEVYDDAGDAKVQDLKKLLAFVTKFAGPEVKKEKKEKTKAKAKKKKVANSIPKAQQSYGGGDAVPTKEGSVTLTAKNFDSMVMQSTQDWIGASREEMRHFTWLQ